jgi:hypothetical protein
MPSSWTGRSAWPPTLLRRRADGRRLPPIFMRVTYGNRRRRAENKAATTGRGDRVSWQRFLKRRIVALLKELPYERRIKGAGGGDRKEVRPFRAACAKATAEQRIRRMLEKLRAGETASAIAKQAKMTPKRCKAALDELAPAGVIVACRVTKGRRPRPALRAGPPPPWRLRRRRCNNTRATP